MDLFTYTGKVDSIQQKEKLRRFPRGPYPRTNAQSQLRLRVEDARFSYAKERGIREGKCNHREEKLK